MRLAWLLFFWHWFKRHLNALFTALILAIAVWVSAVLDSDPNTQGWLPYTVPLEVHNLPADMIVTNGLPQAVRLRVRAPQSVWERLTTEPSLVEAVADLKGIDHPGNYIVSIQPLVEARPVQILEYDPQELTLTLDYLASRTLPVEVEQNGEVALGYYTSRPLVSPSRVTLTGPASELEQVAKVIVTVDLNNTRESIRRTLRPLPVDAEGHPVTGLTIDPETVALTIPVRQLGGYRDVAVKVVLKGQVAQGYRITNVSVSPPVVTVFSQDPELVRALPGYVETEPLDISGATDDLDASLKINLPEGITLVGLESVLVQVNIAAIEGSVTYTVPIEAIGLPLGMEAVIQPSEIDVILSGPLPVLDKLSQTSLRATVDLSDLPLGTHQVEPVVEVLAKQVTVDAINPTTVEVTIQPAPTPTPTTTP